jgi:hypothetical protein
LDKTVKDGLGLRWSFMGFVVLLLTSLILIQSIRNRAYLFRCGCNIVQIDLNAPGGVKDYVERYSGNMYALAQQQATARKWEGQVVDTVVAARRAVIPVESLPERAKWRDSRLMGLMAHKAQMERAGMLL